SRLEADELPRSSADRMLWVVPHRQQVDDVAHQLIEERRWRMQPKANGALVHLARPLQVDSGQLPGGDRRRLRVQDPPDREQEVICVCGLAVVELDMWL